MSQAGPIVPVPSITLDSRLAETRRLHDWIDDVFSGSAVSAIKIHAVRLCLEEAVVNVIMHGYGNGSPGTITVALSMAQGAILTEIRDHAAPFDPVQAARSPAPARNDPDAVGGRGLQLMRRFADAWHYQRQDGCNQLSFTFRLPAPPGESPPA